jgi:HAMP domain-containing protein
MEKHGDAAKLKCSNLEQYAAKLGINVKAYDFRRDEAVRRRIDELSDNTANDRISALTYKNLDADALIANHPTRATLKAALLELDANWRRVYERSVAVAAENTTLISENNSKKRAIAELTGEILAAQDEIKELKRAVNEQQGQIRYLKSMLEARLYPALANEILRRDGILSQADTEVSAEAVATMTDTDTPLPFSEAIAPDELLLSREQQLLERMRKQIKGDQPT